jgi:hypothetical protein
LAPFSDAIDCLYLRVVIGGLERDPGMARMAMKAIIWAILFLILVAWHAHAQTGIFPQNNSPATALVGTEQVPCVQSGFTRICAVNQVSTSTYAGLHGDCTATSSGTMTCPATGGHTFGPLATAVGPVPVANGGTGTAAPALVPGTNISINGAWPNQTINDTLVPVTNVGQTFTGGIISVANSPITTTGTLSLTVAGTSGGLVYFPSPTSWASSPALPANLPIQGGGPGAAPSTFTPGGDVTFSSPNFTVVKIGGAPIGTFATQNFATPPAIGATTAAPVFATTLSATGLTTLTGAINIMNGANGVQPVINASDNGGAASFVTPPFNFTSTENYGSFASGSTHFGFVVQSTKTAPGSNTTGSRQAFVVQQFGAGGTAADFFTGGLETAAPTAGAFANSGNFTGNNTNCSIPPGMTPTSCVSQESDLSTKSNVTNIREGLRIVDIGSTGNFGAITDNAIGIHSSGIGFKNGVFFDTGTLSPTGAAWTSPGFIVTGAGNLDITNTGADGATLFSTLGFGFPPLKSGLFTSGLNSQAMRYISTYFAQTALYATTTLGNAQGETGLYIAWNNMTGYQNPATATGGQKTAIQVSGSCSAGGGVCWDEAESLKWDSGWQGAFGNFSAVHEIDPGPNNSGATFPGSTTQIFGLWLAGVIGANPITSYLQISPAGLNGAVFAAHYGINIGGATTVDLADINTSSSATNGYVDTGIHVGNAIVLQGTYATTGLDITGTTPAAINVSGANISTVDFNASSHATNSYVDSGTHSGNAIVLQGIYSTTAMTITGNSPAGLSIVSTNIANSDIVTNTHATNGYVDNGTHSNGIVLQGTYSTTALTATGAIATTGVFSQNGHTGVTCAGTPTASFASFGGIVTHC